MLLTRHPQTQTSSRAPRSRSGSRTTSPDASQAEQRQDHRHHASLRESANQISDDDEKIHTSFRKPMSVMKWWWEFGLWHGIPLLIGLTLIGVVVVLIMATVGVTLSLSSSAESSSGDSIHLGPELLTRRRRHIVPINPKDEALHQDGRVPDHLHTHVQSSTNVGVGSILEEYGFEFARSETQFLLETTYAKKPDDPNTPLYSKEDLRKILRAFNVMRSFTLQGMWSGNIGTVHFIGTADCLVRLKRPAVEVAVGVMHSTYLQKWRDHVFVKNEPECDQRHRMAQVLGSEVEQALWLDTGLYGNGPWDTCLTTYAKAYDYHNKVPDDHIQSYDQFRSPEMDRKVKMYLDELPLHVLMCDEVEEAIGGEAIASGHWKRRNVATYETLRLLATENYLNETEMLPWIAQGRAMSHAIHHHDGPKHFKELTPKSVYNLVHEQVEDENKYFHPDLSSDDQGRWTDMEDLWLKDRMMFPKWNGPKPQQALRMGIKSTRDNCDAYIAQNKTFESYLDAFFSKREQLLKCERTDERFKTAIPCPEVPPKWAYPKPLWDIHSRKP